MPISMLLILVVVMAVPAYAVAVPSTFETPPVLRGSELATPAMLKGPHFVVEEDVPTTDLVTRFIIRSDYGVFEAHGRDMLAVRVVEMGALDQLAKTSKTEEFARAVGRTAVRPVTAAANMASHPVDTVKGTPAAVGRFFDRVELGTRSLMQSSSTGSATAGQTARRVGSVAADALGYEEERRALAKRLGVDPYTTNHVLADKLDEITWVAFSGRLGVSVVESVVVPYSFALSTTTTVNDLVWDMKPADLLNLADQKLRAMGVADQNVRALLANPWYTLTMLTALVNGLEALDGVRGRNQIVQFAALAPSEDRARLVVGAVQMLAGEQTATHALVQVTAPGPLVARTRTGGILIPVALDYLPWTERVSTFSQRPDLRVKDRTVWLTGQASPRARQELTAAGWMLRENSQYPVLPSAPAASPPESTPMRATP